ncbi:adenosine deaminase [Vibrio sp. SCSIO 43137]|nr:adenosine deaminase [Vibrio sp. SCSIO 43137]WCE31582.1 adenosine deaminase [Vibrio sp. SCSIO 43137]
MKKSHKKSPKKENKVPEGDIKNTKSARRKIEDILEKRNFDKLFEL